MQRCVLIPGTCMREVAERAVRTNVSSNVDLTMRTSFLLLRRCTTLTPSRKNPMTCGRPTSTTAIRHRTLLECAIHRTSIDYTSTTAGNLRRKMQFQTIDFLSVLTPLNGIMTMRLVNTAVSNLHNQSDQSA